MQARQQGGGQGQDNAYDFLWGLLIAIAVVWGTWYFGHEYITKYTYQLKYYQIIAIRFVLEGWNYIVSLVHLPSLQASLNNLNIWATEIRNGTMPDNLKTLERILTEVGNYIRYPVALILLLLAAIVYSKNIVLRFKTVFDMKRIRIAEQSNWPQITPVISQNLVKEDINKGPWAMAMTPTQFCRAQKLFKEKVGDDGKPAVDVIRADAHQVFMLQLGSLWMGPSALPIHAKALFAIFAACANQDRDSAFNLLKQIDVSSGQGKLNFEGVQPLLAKHYNSKLVGRVLQKHAYVFTVMAAMLELARTDGVFASSEFLWLKPLDRRLWYILNTVGRQTAVSEIAGIFSHFVAEKKWGGALRTPMVEEAVKGLELAISEVIYEPEEEE